MSGQHEDDKTINNIRTRPAHIYDNITRKLLRLGVSLAISTFIGLMIRYAVQEFDSNVSTISVSTSRVNDREVAQLNVSRHFLQRLLEFIEESLSLVASCIPLGFPLCTLFNRYFARIRASPSRRLEIRDERALACNPKYVVIGDSAACQLAAGHLASSSTSATNTSTTTSNNNNNNTNNNNGRLRPLIRDTIYYLIRAHLKPKLLVEDSYEDARKLGLRMGLISRQHHRLAVIKSVDLVRLITDSRGDIKQAKVRYLLGKLKIMSQSTPADKSFLIYLIKHCESLPNEHVLYLGHSFTDPEAMRVADCALVQMDCDDDDVKQEAQVVLKSDNFTDLYLFAIICLLSSNVTQSFALYQVSAAVSSCLYRFLSIIVFQEQLVSHSQFMLLMLIQQVLAIAALMTKWLASLPQQPLKANSVGGVAQMSHAISDEHALMKQTKHQRHHKSVGQLDAALPSLGSSADRHHKSSSCIRMDHLNGPSIRMADQATTDDDLDSLNENQNSSNNDSHGSDSTSRNSQLSELDTDSADGQLARQPTTSKPKRTNRRPKQPTEPQMVHLSGLDLDESLINSKPVMSFRQTYRNSTHLLEDATYKLTKLHVAYQLLVMVIVMIFGNSMFQLNTSSSRQQQSLALNSLMMNNIFNLTNCFNQAGKFNLRAGIKSNPFFLCVLLIALFVQVTLTELNAFGLENLNPIQWFVCFVFALLSSLIAPITGQQQPASSKRWPRRDLQRQPTPPPQQQQQQRQQQQVSRRSTPVGKQRQPKQQQQQQVDLQTPATRRPTTPKSRASSAPSKRQGRPSAR